MITMQLESFIVFDRICHEKLFPCISQNFWVLCINCTVVGLNRQHCKVYSDSNVNSTAH